VTDVALAGALVLWTAAASAGSRESLAATLLLAAGAIAVAARRRWPVAVLLVTLVPYVVTRYSGTGQPAVLVALYTVASLCSQRTAILATALAAGSSVAAVVVHGDSVALAVGRVVEVVFAALLGLVVAERRRQRDREAAMLARIAAADERVRIARELHDVVAHHLSVIVVQANLAAETIKPDHPAFAPAHAIVAEGREALDDTRRVLGVLRTRDDPEAHAPQPGLAALDELLDRVRAAGLEVRLSTKGDPPSIPTGLDLTVYRIVQEALTNTLRHAHASEARVSITYSPRSIALEVADNGVGPGENGSTSPGHGLDGMRERAALFGGTLTAGPNPGRGYRVEAELPV
jgi:signal transduction histidine kinase